MNTRQAYEEALREQTPRVEEFLAATDSELAWQARWFSGACGRRFVSEDGQEVFVAGFGEWNREAGPDFANACVRIAGEERRGAVEVDLDAAGWEQHRHATNPDYENVILHVVVRPSARRHFPRSASNRAIPQICLSAKLPEGETPRATAPSRHSHCRAPLRDLPPEKLSNLLAAAARRRLEQKGAALAAMIDAHGIDAALYEGVAIALGYKNNKLPMQLLAQRVPSAVAATVRGEALLFGLAGFLEKPQPPSLEARDAIASLWKNWWRQRAEREHLILPRTKWRLTGLRPSNHPLRRLGALAMIARHWKYVRIALESGELPALEKVLGTLRNPFWSFHTTWNSPRRSEPLSLIGSDRVRDIYANISLPLAIARGAEPRWLDLSAAASNSTSRLAAERLFGGPLPRALRNRLYAQHGLLQIHTDFCKQSHGECSRCRFPGLVERLSA